MDFMVYDANGELMTLSGEPIAPMQGFFVKVTETTTVFIKNYACPTGAINGLFSVSGSRQVYFSRGNLQYQASTNTWRFAEHQYDYIGNPSLKNESAVELNGAVKWHPTERVNVALDGNVFLFSNYIIGQFETRLSPMTVDAEGVKVYGNISHATIANASLTAEWQLMEQLRWNGKVSYSSGRDADGDPLPLISPVSWQMELQYNYQRLQAQATVKGNTRQNCYGKKYGETAASEWAIINLSAQYGFLRPFGSKRAELERSSMTVRVGIENVFDKHYATYADWNHIPQKGRNIYLNLTFAL